MDIITAVKERPILFSTPMVKAILEGRKTVTRRIVDIHPELAKDVTKWGYSIFTPEGHISARTKQKTDTGHRYGEKFIKLKYGKPGDVLWVRETWAPFLRGDGGDGYMELVKFKADGFEAPWTHDKDYAELGWHWRPSIHMPKAACRLRLEIVSIGVELSHNTEESQEELTALDLKMFIEHELGGYKTVHIGRAYRVINRQFVYESDINSLAEDLLKNFTITRKQ